MSQLLQTAQKEIIEDAVPVVLPKSWAKSLEIRWYLFFMESTHQHKNLVRMFLMFYHRTRTSLSWDLFILSEIFQVIS